MTNSNCLKIKADDDCHSAALHIEHLCFSYGFGQPVLNDISLCLHHGVFLGIIGPNGGGKSTLLKLSLGLLKPNSGTISIFGQDISQNNSWRTKVGYVPQHNSIDTTFPAATIDIITMAANNKTNLKNRAFDLMEKCGIAELAYRPIGNMSGGQRQRVFIARALINNPMLLLLDEPTTGVDSKGQQDFFTFLRTLQDNFDLSLLMVSHNIGQLTHYADKIACINRKLHWHDKALMLTDEVVQEVYDCELNDWQKQMRTERENMPSNHGDSCHCEHDS